MAAFYPHMGADLGNGKVVQNQIQCYFYQRHLDGEVYGISYTEERYKNARVNVYPVEQESDYI